MQSINSAINNIQQHYTCNDLGNAILSALELSGKDLENLIPEDLAPIDEFHIRGREATTELAQKLQLNASKHVLDVGCGIGGAARYLALTYGCQVTGLDLNEKLCNTARLLTDLLDLSSLVQFHHGNAIEMPFDDASFDIAWTQHASMNIEDKPKLYSEIRRVLKPGGLFALYDVLAGSGGEVYYPVPWAREPSINFIITPELLHQLLQNIGFQIVAWRDTSEEGKEWLKKIIGKMKTKSRDAPLGFQLIVGSDFKIMAENQVRNLNEKRIVLIEAVVKK